MRRPYVPVVSYRVDSISAKEAAILDYIGAAYSRVKELQTTLTHKVTAADEFHPDAVSYQYYGREDLWWVIMIYNSIRFPLKEMVAGTTLYIPDIQDLNDLLQTDTSAKSSSLVII